jgi:hypothetical protein
VCVSEGQIKHHCEIRWNGVACPVSHESTWAGQSSHMLICQCLCCSLPCMAAAAANPIQSVHQLNSCIHIHIHPL